MAGETGRVPFSGPEFPFCGERCRPIGLGNGVGEAYPISTPPSVMDRGVPDAGGETPKGLGE